MTADLLAILDQLDEARAKATPGEWWVDGPGARTGEWWVYALGQRFARREDADAIVAEHNAQPKLTAALRAVLALADELEGYTRHRGRPAGGSYDYGVNLAQADAADGIRSAITAALTPEGAS